MKKQSSGILKELLGNNVKIEVKSARNGLGIFTKSRIMKGAIIFDVVGEAVMVPYEDDLEENRWFGIARETWLIVDENNPMYYMNHSCNPNCGIANKTQITALREIETDEELTFDYSSSEEDPYWDMDCNCGYKFCRKLITAAAKFTSDEQSTRRAFKNVH